MAGGESSVKKDLIEVSGEGDKQLRRHTEIIFYRLDTEWTSRTRGAESKVVHMPFTLLTFVIFEPAPEGQGLEVNHDVLLSVPAGGIHTAESPVSCLS